jgi:hypothetical protein
MKKKRFFLFILIISGMFSQPIPFQAQRAKTEVLVYNDYLFPKSGIWPLPKNPVELKRLFYFDSAELKYPMKTASDPSGNIYVIDIDKKMVLKFEPSGRLLFRIGDKGREKGNFRSSGSISVNKNSLAVLDNFSNKKGTFFFDLEGSPLKKYDLYGFDDLVLTDDGSLYLAPRINDKSTPLIQVCSPDKKIMASFGASINFDRDLGPLNSRRLAISPKGEIYVAFSYFPIVRRYSPKGELLTEFKIDNDILKAKEKLNLKLIDDRRDDKREYGYAYINATIAVRAFEDKIYILSDYPRLEIVEIEETGNIAATYWMDFDEIYRVRDFIVQRINGELRFYVVNYSPSSGIDVFVKK